MFDKLNWIRLSLIVLTAVFGPFAITAGDSPSAELEAYMKAAADLGHFSGSVLVARQGQVLLRAAYGLADIDAKIPNRPDTKFRIASLTKSFTATAILALGKKGLLRLDDPLSDYFPEGPGSWKKITLDHLVHHTSGIPDYEEIFGGLSSEAYAAFRAKPGSLAKILEKALESELEFEPGEQFKYSNTGYLLLGHIVEKTAGRSFETFVKEEFLKPFGMSQTGEDRYDLVLENRAKGYLRKPGWSFKEYLAGFAPDSGMLLEATPMHMESPNGAGGFYSTVDDLHAWVQGLTKLAETEPSYSEAFIPGMKGYGFGWFIGEQHGRKRFWHLGELPGYTSILEHFPKENATVVLLGNTDQYGGRLAEDLAAILFGEAYPMPRAHLLVELEPERLKPLHGDYRRDDGRIYRVYPDGDMLVIEHKDQFIAGMLPESEVDFFVPMFRGNVSFQINEEGTIAGLIAYIHGKKVVLTKEK